jgi:hypothetical protein
MTMLCLVGLRLGRGAWYCPYDPDTRSWYCARCDRDILTDDAYHRSTFYDDQAFLYTPNWSVHSEQLRQPRANYKIKYSEGSDRDCPKCASGILFWGVSEHDWLPCPVCGYE